MTFEEMENIEKQCEEITKKIWSNLIGEVKMLVYKNSKQETAIAINLVLRDLMVIYFKIARDHQKEKAYGLMESTFNSIRKNLDHIVIEFATQH